MRLWKHLRRRSQAAAGLPADFLTAPADALPRVAERLAWAWMLMAGLMLFVAWWMHEQGWWRRLVDGDPSGISWVIVLLAVAVTGWCGQRVRLLQAEARAPAGPWRQAYRRELAQGPAEAGQLLAERSHGPHETAWWFAAATIKLGLLGTVVGFIVMAAQLGRSQSFELAEVQQLLQQMTAGMAIALYTTLVGLVANLWLGLQLLLLDRLADRLAADILAGRDGRAG